jgi:hypothetical protein
MSHLSATESTTLADEVIGQPDARTYSLPKHGLPKYLAGLVLQVVVIGIIAIALAFVAYFAFPAEEAMRSYAVLLCVIVFPLLPIGTFFLLRRHKGLWQQVKVEVGDCYITVRHGGVPLEVRILPQPEVRVESGQITAIRKMPYGLVISTQYDSEALVIPAQLDNADYQEIVATLSAWCPVQAKSLDTTAGAISQAWRRILDSVSRPQSTFQFYELASSALAAGVMTSCVIIALSTLAIVLGVRDLQVPRSQGVVILAIYLIIMFGTLIGFPIAFAWLDYGLANMGVGKPVRSGMWVGIATAVMVSAVTIVARLSVFTSLIAVFVCALVVAGLTWFLSLLMRDSDHTAESSTPTRLDSTPRSAEADAESRFPIQGSYRLTSNELFIALGYFYKAQPRSFRSLESNEDLLWASSIPFSATQPPSSADNASQKSSKRASRECSSLLQIRPLPARAFRLRHHLILLPRSIDRKAVKKLASSHPLRNRAVSFFVNANAITWKITDSEESTSWERVTKVICTPKGFLIYQDRRAFDWIPFHAFSRGGPKVFAKLARHLTEYSKTA